MYVVIAVLGLTSTTGRAQSTAQVEGVRIPEPEIHRIVSKSAEETFEIRVLMPPMLPGEQRRFPVVYMTDASGESTVSDTMLRVLMLADTPRFIVVQIGYASTRHYFQTFMLRQRDLTPTTDENERKTSVFAGTPFPAVRSGRAEQFLAFIREELIPFIDSKYPTDPGDRTYAGHSLGGLFGCYALFTHPETFRRYVIGSPSLYWGREYLFTLADRFAETHRDLPATVFLGVGGREDGPGNPMRKNVERLDSFFRSKQFSNLKVTTHVFPEETHLTAWTMNLEHGLVAVFGRPSPDQTPAALYQRQAASKTPQ